MPEFVVFIICILIITVFFIIELSLSERKPESPKEEVVIPSSIQEAFSSFTEALLAQKGILVESAQITDWSPLEEVAYREGIFYCYKVDYSVTTETPVGTAQGMILNSREIFEKFGLGGELTVVFYEEKEQISEVTFQPAEQIALTGGCKSYVEKRYSTPKEWQPRPEYSVYLDEISLSLWENIAGKTLPEGLIRNRTLAEGHIADRAQYVDTLENDHIKVDSCIQFGGKQERVFRIEVRGTMVENRRGIHIGSTVQELKEAYPEGLAYEENWQEQGAHYGYIAEDESTCYIAFKVEDGVISQILLTDGFGQRPFTPYDGYVDPDIRWVEVENPEQLSEKYARELYLGQHKLDSEPEQVVTQFLARSMEGYTVIKKGLLREEDRGQIQIYFAACKMPAEPGVLHLELKLEYTRIDNYMNDTAVWVVTHHRGQKREG